MIHPLAPHPTPPPAGYGIVHQIRHQTTTDIDVQAALLPGWTQTYEQISAGRFEGSLLDIRLGALRILREFTSAALRQEGTVQPGYIAIGLLSPCVAQAVFCGHTCRPEQALVFSGGDPFEFHSPAGLEIIDLVLPREQLLRCLTEDEGRRLDRQLAQPHLRNVSSTQHQLLRYLLREATAGVTTDVRHPLSGAQFANLAGAITHQIAQLLLSGDDSPPAAALAPDRHAAIVQQARLLLLQEHESPPGIERVCDQLGICRRTLQNAFQRVLGISPHTYLRALRLNRARQALKQGMPVAEAATRWGFWHLSRFAHDYKALFGELPSHTRCDSRHRASHGVLDGT